MNKRKLSKVVAGFILVNNLREFVIDFFFLCHKISFNHNVELAAEIALLDYVLSSIVFLFLEDIVKLLSKLRK